MPSASRPATVADAVRELKATLSPTELKQVAGLREDELIGLHFSLGMQIRNVFGLFEEDSELRADAARTSGYSHIHPDSASTLIIERLWSELKTDLR